MSLTDERVAKALAQLTQCVSLSDAAIKSVQDVLESKRESSDTVSAEHAGESSIDSPAGAGD